jgi:misacylated tRNA(Ala) deacylase
MTALLFRDDAYLPRCEARVVGVSERGVVLDRTVFYAQGGGQPGDCGMLRLADGRSVAIADTRKGDGIEEVLHIPASGAALPAVGDAVLAEIDWERRYRLMRMHTCLHLLCAAVPNASVTGGQIADGKGRLDFDIPGDALDKAAITAQLNALIAADHEAMPRWIADQELAARPELVRTMSVKPPIGHGRIRLLDIAGVDLQPCGGTHVRRTGEIGPVEVVKIENKGRQNRRVIVAFAG